MNASRPVVIRGRFHPNLSIAGSQALLGEPSAAKVRKDGIRASYAFGAKQLNSVSRSAWVRTA